MLKVVSNTTPLISLLKLSRLDILKDLYTEISIPFAVFQEIEAGKNKGIIKDLKPLLYELTKKNVWISDMLIDDILKQAGEQ